MRECPPAIWLYKVKKNWQVLFQEQLIFCNGSLQEQRRLFTHRLLSGEELVKGSQCIPHPLLDGWNMVTGVQDVGFAALPIPFPGLVWMRWED